MNKTPFKEFSPAFSRGGGLDHIQVPPRGVPAAKQRSDWRSLAPLVPDNGKEQCIKIKFGHNNLTFPPLPLKRQMRYQQEDAKNKKKASASKEGG